MSREKKLSIAIVYDRVNTQFGGAEIVLSAIHELYPDAPVFTSVFDQKKSSWANNITIIPSLLQHIPFFRDKHQLLVLFMPFAFESFDLSTYDLIISVTSAEAKGVITKPNQLHICYMLTPTRYLYSHKDDYLTSQWYLQVPGVKQLTSAIFSHVSRWDKVACTRPDVIVPISNLVANRVKTYYKRKTKSVLYPPVTLAVSDKLMEEIPKLTGTRKYYLSVSRLVDYKKIDISIKACIKLNKPLIIVGDGDAKLKLYKTAGQHLCIKQPYESLRQFLDKATKAQKLILFTGKLEQKERNILFFNCEALLMPGQEDFGITALEAGIFGKPVILFYRSGVAELLQDNMHAVYIKKETVPEMVYALGKLEFLSFNAKTIRQNAEKYNLANFKQKFKKRIETELKGHYVIS